MEPLRLPPNLATDSAPRAAQAAAKVQVSAADILSDAHDSRPDLQRPQQSIQDLEELRLFQLAKRRDYEQQLNKNRLNYPQWMRYARWEIEHNHDFRRFRSIMERALEVDPKHVPFWVRYTELELLHKNVNHGRNLLERAVTVLPRVDKLWYMYVQTEESIGNFRGVRLVFERWLLWRPEGSVWDVYVSFEQRYNEHDNVRALFQRYVAALGTCGVWRQWLVFETGLVGTPEQVARIRGVFEAAVDHSVKGAEINNHDLTDLVLAENPQSSPKTADPDLVPIIILWIGWEEAQGESERATAIYTRFLEHDGVSKDSKMALLDQLGDYTAEHGEGNTKRRLRYEQQVAANARDYDAWWEYATFAEKAYGALRCMQVLEKATATAPSDTYKLVTWRRYVFLWIKRALYAEYYLQDISGARAIWRAARAVPLPFAKLWVQSAEFELRHSGIQEYRKTMGAAIGQFQNSPKAKIFKLYIQFEYTLGEYSRVRRLYEKWAELAMVCDAQNETQTAVDVFERYIAFEKDLGESERVIALYDISLLQSTKVLQDYVEFLKDEFRYDSARGILEDHATDAYGWIHLALFELSILTSAQMDELANGSEEFGVGADHVAATREVFEKGYKVLKSAVDGEGANVLLDLWKEYESTHGLEEHAQKVERKRPQRVSRRRNEGGVEEIFYEYEFPETKPDLSKFLANAMKWKKGE